MPQHDLAAFSQRCLNCHRVESCGVFAREGPKIANNCIDGRMPKQETKLIVFEWKGKKARPKVRNHCIKIYPDSRDASHLPHSPDGQGSNRPALRTKEAAGTC